MADGTDPISDSLGPPLSPGCLMSCERQHGAHEPSCVDSKGYFKQGRWWETGNVLTPRSS